VVFILGPLRIKEKNIGLSALFLCVMVF